MRNIHHQEALELVTLELASFALNKHFDVYYIVNLSDAVSSSSSDVLQFISAIEAV